MHPHPGESRIDCLPAQRGLFYACGLATAGRAHDMEITMPAKNTDPRAFSDTKLEAPHPLPYISRRALKRVTDWAEPPESCHYCQAPVFLVSNAEIYGREYGDWPYAYLCHNPDCRAYVGVHPNTDLPLGVLADKEAREARKACKSAFIAVQKANGWSRNQAYAWLAGRMGIPKPECHWGMFGVERAELAGAICQEHLEA